MLANRIILALVIISLTIFPLSVGVASSQKNTEKDVNVVELDGQIKSKKSQIADLRKRIQNYEKNIRMRQAEKASLENEIGIIEDQVSKKTLDVEALGSEIEQLDLEIDQTDLEIKTKEIEIELQKRKLAEYLQKIYEGSQRDYVELFFTYENFSDFFDHIYYLEQAQGNVKNSLAQIKQLREQLTAQKAALDTTRGRQVELRMALEKQKESLEVHKVYKERLIVQTTLSAEKYQSLLEQARREQAEIDSDISRLEKTGREKLKWRGERPVRFTWPVDPSRGISTYFRDPDYPFRNIFEHTAIDIRAYQGTQVVAVEDGYVGRAKDAGKGYSYIMLLHDNGFSSVYGHISRIMVTEDTYVKRGQVIGLSGGSPGTNGAGSYTTGPHLHFEVRLNGIPVDPLQYLP